MVKKYRKRPVIVEALQWTSKNYDEIKSFCGMCYWNGCFPITLSGGNLVIKTLEGDMSAAFNDYIIKGVNGEFYPCKPDIFEKTYEEVM